jgi:hypothetical protein
VDDGVAALEGFHGRFVVCCCVCGAHLRVGDAEFIPLFCAVYLHCCVPGFCTQLGAIRQKMKGFAMEAIP